MIVKKEFKVGEFTVQVFQRKPETKHGLKVTVLKSDKPVASYSLSNNQPAKLLTGVKFKNYLTEVEKVINSNSHFIIKTWYGSPNTGKSTTTKSKKPVVDDQKVTTFVGISRDHSASMQSLTRSAMSDYNAQLESIKKNSNGDVFLTVMKCGIGYDALNLLETTYQRVHDIKSITQYEADGHGTPLFDSVDSLINMLEAQGNNTKGRTAFLVMVITDGQDNRSLIRGEKLGERIKKLQATDKWTFVFRVPQGYGSRLSALLGIPSGNILEWELTKQGLDAATSFTASGIQNYLSGVARGQTSSKSFYTDASKIKASDLRSSMADITKLVELRTVPLNGGSMDVSQFSSKILNRPLQVGTIFYQLMKREANVQDYKIICIRDKTTGKIFGGDSARDLLGMPRTGTHPIIPGDHGKYDVFIQSTSLNRKLPPGTKVLYWEGVPSNAI